MKTKEKLNNKTTKNDIVPVKHTAGMSNFNNMLRDGCPSSCSKHGCSGVSPSLPSRVPVASSPISSSKHTMIPCVRKRSLNKSNLPSLQICPPMTKPGSCCSMCCHDEKKTSEDPKGPRIYSNRQ
ncbi:hypothetical protein KGM_205729 [Danaus plexippus plexippus]|uniref:Uncharacterized protein n=2 Tax=Danaus plexippus TaxID=13037 RepID=A0A212FDZ0_DANPL|nr:hypothetical protein KGM_205729 [Danaus plexippus plexippus]